MATTSLLRRILALPSHARRSVFEHVLRTPICRPSASITSRSLPRTYATYNTTFTADTAPQSSVNNEEVSHFNALASEWWDPHGSSRLLHLMNPLRHRFIRRCLSTSHAASSSHNNLTYLDIGCGGGIFAESAARLPTTLSVTALDPSPQVISIARQHQRTDPLLCRPNRLTYKNIAIEQLPPTHEGYDIITVFEVLEHIQSPSTFLDTALPHLKPGGWLVGSTIARTNTSWFTTKVMAEEVLRMVPRGTHEWKQYIQPRELREWAQTRPELDVVVGGKGYQTMGVVYVPGLGWKEVAGSEEWGNYFFGVRKLGEGEER